MKAIYFVLIIILTFSCNNTTTNTLIDKSELEKEIVDFYSFIIKNDLDSSSYIANRPGFLIMQLDSSLICGDSLFKIDDWEIMKNQRNLFRDFRIENSAINLIDVDSIYPELKASHSLEEHWKILDKHYKGLGFYSYSLPYFNKKRNIVIIENAFHCNGFCGHGKIRVFIKNKNNKWKYIKTLNQWIS